MSLGEKIKERVARLKNKLTAIFLAYKRKDTPLMAKIAAAVTLGYALSPIDLIPDFIPLLGYLDDIILLPLMISLCLKLIPADILQECEKEAAGLWQNGKPKRWVYALPIIIFWLLVAAALVWRIFFKR